MSFAKAKQIHAAMGQAIAAGDHQAAMKHSGQMLKAMMGVASSRPVAAPSQPADDDQGGDPGDATVPPITGPSAPAPKPQPAQSAATMATTSTGRKGHGVGNFIQGAIKHPGALHRELGVPQGQKIPALAARPDATAAAAPDQRTPLPKRDAFNRVRDQAYPAANAREFVTPGTDPRFLEFDRNMHINLNSPAKADSIDALFDRLRIAQMSAQHERAAYKRGK